MLSDWSNIGRRDCLLKPPNSKSIYIKNNLSLSLSLFLYKEAKKISKGGANDNAQSFLLSAHYCIFLSPLWPVTSPNHLLLVNVFTINICMNKMGGQLEKNLREYAGGVE